MNDQPDTSTADRAVIIDMYKVSVEMADRVSARRAGANTLFLTIQSAVIAAIGFLAAREPAPSKWFLVAMALVGVLGSAAWFLLLRRYRDLNKAKFKVIHALETHLPVQPFTDEWHHLARGPRRWWRPQFAELGTIERFIPLLFFTLNTVLAIHLVCS